MTLLIRVIHLETWQQRGKFELDDPQNLKLANSERSISFYQLERPLNGDSNGELPRFEASSFERRTPDANPPIWNFWLSKNWKQLISSFSPRFSSEEFFTFMLFTFLLNLNSSTGFQFRVTFWVTFWGIFPLHIRLSTWKFKPPSGLEVWRALGLQVVQLELDWKLFYVWRLVEIFD